MTENNKSMSLFGGNRVMARPDAKTLIEKMAGSASMDPRGAAADGAEYLNFSGKRGAYELGIDKDDLDPSEPWMVNPHSFQDGWICWKGGRPASKRMASIYDVPVPEPDHEENGPFDPNRGEGWFQAKAFMLRSMETGVQALFTNNSKSGVSTFAGLQKEIAQDMVQHEEARFPIITMGKEAFTSQGNKNYKPKFDILGWVSEAQMTEAMEAGDEEAVLAAVMEMVNGGTQKKTRRATRRDS